MDQKELRAQEAKCIQENPPGCTAGCPVHVDVRGVVAAVRKGDWAAGKAVFEKTVPFPEIIARICDQPCRPTCKRGEIGDPIEINALERICVVRSDQPAPRSPALPAKTSRVAVVGAGLSGLTAALELARKGYPVVVFEAAGQPGGSIRDVPDKILPRQVVEKDLAIFARLPVEFRYGSPVSGDGPGVSLAGLAAEYDAVYLGVGSGQACRALGIAQDAVDPATLATGHPKIFAGGSLRRQSRERSPIASIADGKAAAASVDRLLQGASLTAGRDKEGPYATSLYTNIAGIEPLPAVTAADPAAGYTADEARQEAERCLLCECRECVKACEYLAHYGSYPRRYVREVYNNLSIVMGIHHANKMINTCALCGQCAELCPNSLDMGGVCLEARRMMVERGKMPPSVHDFALRDMAFSAGDAFALARHQPGSGSSRFVFFPGCQQAASSPQPVRKIYEYLCGKLDGGVGLMLGCCGAPANWAGREELFRETLRQTENAWRGLGRPTVVTACPTCYNMFYHNLPEVPVETLWTLLDRIGPPAGAAGLPARKLAVHDSCTTRHETPLHLSIRSLLGRLGHEVEELPFNRETTVCCGYGGLMLFADREVARKTVSRRVGESPADYLTYCAMCRDNFAGQGKRAIYLLDLLFATGGDEPAERPAPGYSERRDNRARLKRELLRELWGETVTEPPAQIKLIVPADVRRILEDRMILDSDVAQVIAHAEETGDKFADTASGRFLACHRPSAVTYWVEYSPADGGFLVHNAYSHRIEILY
ncbi:pyridine nucleotide-disulfide oxidoreductase/dicluster-binding protein [Anaeroselena agilis]|uniref:FAD-dependent oxidoreductase n=1 Tax=Anaeroselena agilis TaxID=3063788 RepID=A0ABU3NV46_9FIRM|nr:FAD-dependent oxidoreductase [Selenomonadales bacterium 4137-cl]